MKKLLVVLFCLQITLFNIYSETQLEKLWHNAEIYNTNILLSKNQYKKMEIEYKYRYSIYIPSFSFSIYSEFIESDYGLTKLPSEGTAQLGFQWSLPGGTTFGTSLIYDMNRYVLNSLEEESYDNTGYDQNPEISISLSQSLQPYWIQGNFKNPILISYNNQLESEKNALSSTIAEEKKLIANKYIELRKLVRSVRLMENQKAVQQLLVDSAQVKILNGSLSQIELWNYESTLLNCKNNIQELNFQIKQINQELIEMCGFFDFVYDEVLPSYEIKLLEKDFTLESLRIQKLEQLNQLVLFKQNYAPTFTISGTYVYRMNPVKIDELKKAWNGNNKNNWTVSFGIGINPENLSYIKKTKEQYEETNKALEIQEVYYLENLKENIKTLKNMIEYYEILLLQAQEEMNQKKSYLDAIKKKYKRGECSIIDFKQAEIMYESSRYNISNYEDLIWYYKFLEYQFI